MKRLLLAALLLVAIGAQAQPFLRNSFTTNAVGRTPSVLPTSTNTIYPLMVLNPDGSGGDRQILYSQYLTMTGVRLTANGGEILVGPNSSNYFSTSFSQTINPTLFNFRDVSAGDLNDGLIYSEVGDSPAFGSGGAMSLSTATNFSSLSMIGYNSVSSVAFSVVANSAATSPFGKLTQEGTVSGVGWLFAPDTAATNIAYKFNTTRTHTSSNLLSVANNGTNKFSVMTEGQVTLQGLTNQIGDNGSTITYNGSPISGDTTATNIVTLTQTGTNISQLDFALVARGGTFKLSLTNNGYIGAPAGVASTPFSKCTLYVQQPSTGTCFLTFSNGFWSFPEGVAPIIDTNNGAITIYEFKSNLFTNGLVDGWMSLKSKLIP